MDEKRHTLAKTSRLWGILGPTSIHRKHQKKNCAFQIFIFRPCPTPELAFGQSLGLQGGPWGRSKREKVPSLVNRPGIKIQLITCHNDSCSINYVLKIFLCLRRPNSHLKHGWLGPVCVAFFFESRHTWPPKTRFH